MTHQQETMDEVQNCFVLVKTRQQSVFKTPWTRIRDERLWVEQLSQYVRLNDWLNFTIWCYYNFALLILPTMGSWRNTIDSH